jgi:tryptophanyl-tRNA synthetase
MSLRNGAEKMSKSAESDMTRIILTDDADTIADKIRKARTDPDALPDSLEGLRDRAEALNLITIYAALAEQTREQTIQLFAGKQFSEFKPALADLAVAKLSPITQRMNELLSDKAEIDRILAQGADKARAIAGPVLQGAMDIMGFWRAKSGF